MNFGIEVQIRKWACSFDSKRVKWRIQRELDEVLNSDHVLSVKKEPVLPMKEEDRTEWLLWCCYVRGCSMDEANQFYLKANDAMQQMANRLMERRQAKRQSKEEQLERYLKRRERKNSCKGKNKPT